MATATDPKRAILDAALAAFAQHGYEATTIEHVKRGSGASTGSVYHHFGDKRGIAAALYVDGLRAYQESLLRALGRVRDDGARAGVRTLVRHHLRWVGRNRELARFLFSRAGGEAAETAREEIREVNRRTFGEVGAWLAEQAEAGAIRRLPPDLAYAILLGPAQEHARHVLAGRTPTSLRAAEEHLVEAAWRAVATHATEDHR